MNIDLHQDSKRCSAPILENRSLGMFVCKVNEPGWEIDYKNPRKSVPKRGMLDRNRISQLMPKSSWMGSHRRRPNLVVAVPAKVRTTGKAMRENIDLSEQIGGVRARWR
jgi:hypothetical protein